MQNERTPAPALVPITHDKWYRANAWRDRSPDVVDDMLDRIVAEVTKRIWVATSSPFSFSIDEARLRREMLYHLHETSVD